MNIFKFITKLPKLYIVVLGYLLVILFGIIDRITGFEISFSIFYLLPIILIAWYVGRLSSIFISILSTTTWLVADLASGHYYSHFVIPLWNSIMRLGFFLIVSYFVTIIKNLLEEEKELSRIDFLTKVANSRYLYELADIEIDRSVRFGRPLTSAYIDIDNFKQVNDLFGHAEGDRLLRSVAITIKENIRAIDIIARVGGDEFFVLMPETGEEQAKTVINRVRKHLSDIVKINKWPITFSIGVVIYNKPPFKIDKMIKDADGLMYSAKTNGKNNVFYKTYDSNGRIT